MNAIDFARREPDPEFQFPPEPEVAPEQRVVLGDHLSYRNVSQDGHLLLDKLIDAASCASRASSLSRHPGLRLHAVDAELGAVTSLATRFVAELGAPVAIHAPIAIHSAHRLAHTVDAKGQINRLVATYWVRVLGAARQASGAPLAEPVDAGRFFLESTLVRRCAPSEFRKVLGLEVDGSPVVPPDRYEGCSPQALLKVPKDARPLDQGFRPDEASIVFGLRHTDCFGHVNSTIYVDLFEDAALRRLAAHGIDTRRMFRHLEVTFRKPFYAGESARLLLRIFEHRGRPGAIGAFLPARSAPNERVSDAHVQVRMLFTE